jgi:hypothetical protein
MVRTWNRAKGLPLLDDWTHEWQEPSQLCDGTTGIRRNRIDYLFASTPGIPDAVLEAHADLASDGDYSDHRIVWGLLRVTPRV